MSQFIETRLYKHYKNKFYKLLGTARHSESLDELALYETMTFSDLGKTWVRPKAMFFGSMTVDGQTKPRFAPVRFSVKKVDVLSNQDKSQIVNLLDQVFEEFTPEMLDKKIADFPKVFLVSLFHDERFVGFKFGYELNPDVFYSSLGAVDPEYRGFGLGQALIDEQHNWCLENGYSKISTKTKNKWKSMLLLNIRNGYEIVGTEKRHTGEVKIVLEKNLRD